MVMHVELQATCSALGYLEGKKYIKEPDCLETVKDLIRFLKREDDTCDIRRQLGHAAIVQNDLLQLIKYYKDDAVLFDTVLRLLVNLTQPAYLCFNNQIPEDKTLRNYYLEIESHLYNYKEAFVDEELFAVLTEKIGDILKLDWEHRQEEDKLTLERMLILLRNVLHIAPDPSMEKRTDDDASLHDQIIWVLHVSGMEDMLLYIASADDERQLCMHILEIISLMFREQKPEVLASAGVKKSQSEKEAEERELEMIREQERAKRRTEFLKQSSRHSRFGGTYVVKNLKSISEREMIYHKAKGDVEAITLNDKKRRTKIAKNRQPIKDTEVCRRSTLSIRLCLKEFCVQFLENCYNPIIFAVKDNLVREKTQDHDETYYLWSVRFFMEFCRLHSKRVELVSETMSTTTFHYIYTNLLNYYEMMLTEKKEAKVWGRRAHLALKAYQELMLTLDSMDRSGNPQVMESSKVIKGNLFYMMEYRDIFVTLLRKFNQSQMSRAYLKDLIESTHLFVKMLEAWSKKGTLVVQKKKSKKKTKKPKEKKSTSSTATGPSELELEDMWDEISSDLSAMIQGREDVPTDISPFDAASEVDVDQQRVDAMIRIQDKLRDKNPGEALAIFRAAREVWPERNEFGALDISAEEEFMAIREVFLAPLPRPETEIVQETEEYVEEYNEVEEEEMEFTERAEQSFDFKNYLNTYAKGSIMKSYGLLLADYHSNTTHTNHCIIKMFYRVAIELGYIGMLFQASIFRTFQLLMYGPYVKLPRYKEILKFGTYLVSHFVKAADGNTKIFMEILFWKSSPEAMDIIHGYGYTANNKSKSLWTEEQEQEVGRLFEEARHVTDPEKDVADRIMERLTDPTKTRNQLIRQLKRQGLIDNAADLKTKKRYDNTPWREEEELTLRTLFERYKDSDDPIGNILNSDDINRSKSHVISKLIELDIIYDKSQVDKNRKPSRKKPSVQWEEEDEIKLRTLFEEYRHAEEPLKDILLSLIGKNKNQVIDKLIDLELISHRAEIDKKYKNKKKKTQKDVWGNFDGEENLPDFSSSDEETRQRRLDCNTNLLERAESSDEAEHPGQSDQSASDSLSSDLDDASDVDKDHGGHDSDSSPKKTKGSSSTSSPVNMKEMISDIVKCGYKDQMKWLQKSMQRTAANRQKNNSQVPIAVVPLTEENENAMEDEKFLTFMRHLGFSPPSNEQEAFWRIPGELAPDQLTCIVQGLELNENDEPSNADKIPTSLLQQNQQSHQNDKKKAKEEKKIKKKQEKERKEKERKENAERKKKLRSKLEALKALKESRKRKRSVNNNDSSSDSSDDEVVKKKISPKQKPARKGRKIQKMVDSDNDSNQSVKLTNGHEVNMSKSEDNNNLSTNKKKSRLIQSSDSESEINDENKNKSDKDDDDDDDKDNDDSDKEDNDDNDIEMSNTDYRLQLQSDSSSDSSDDEVVKKKISPKQKPARKGRKIQKMVDSDNDSNQSVKLTNGHEVNMSKSEDNNNLSTNKKKSRLIQSSDSESEINDENKNKSDKDDDDDDKDNDDKDNDDNDIEMSNTDYRLQLQSDSEVEESQASNKSKQSTIKSDSDSNDDQPLKNTSESFPATMLTQGTDSDSDVNDHIPLRKVLKKQIISSDED